MKNKIIVISATFLILLFLSQVSYAHSGRTDSNGGHNSAYGYHYHHGYPEHQHTNGICPYNYDDQTNHSSSSNSSSITQEQHDYNDNSNSSNTIKIPTIKQDSDNAKDDRAIDFKINIVVFVIIASLLFPIFIHDFLEFIRNEKKYSEYKLANPFPTKIKHLRSEIQRDSITKLPYEVRSKLLSKIENIQISNACRSYLLDELEKDKYKTVVWELIKLGIYEDYFYDILETNIPKGYLIAYADYKSFLQND